MGTRHYCDMTRLVKGASEQDLHVCWAVIDDQEDGPLERQYKEEVMTVLCHHMDHQKELLGLLEVFSQPNNGRRSMRLAVYQDTCLKDALALKLKKSGSNIA